jgi:hypothetical protein
MSSLVQPSNLNELTERGLERVKFSSQHTTFTIETVLCDLVPCLGQRHELHFAIRFRPSIRKKQQGNRTIHCHKHTLRLKALEWGRTCIAVTNSANPRYPWRLESAIAHTFARKSTNSEASLSIHQREPEAKPARRRKVRRSRRAAPRSPA